MTDDGRDQIIRNIFRKISENIRQSIPERLTGVIVLQENDHTQDHEHRTTGLRLSRAFIVDTDVILSDKATNFFIDSIISMLEVNNIKLEEFIEVKPLDRTGLGIYNIAIVGKFKE